MIEALRAFNEYEWTKRSAEETVDFLNENFGPNECDRLALIACFMNTAIFEARTDELLFWSIVSARRQRRRLNAASRRELQAFLDDSKHWPS